MNKPKVKAAARELWVAPEGWVKPAKPVQSWYDKGVRLDDAPRQYPYVRSWYDLGLRLKSEAAPEAAPEVEVAAMEA